MEAKIDSLKELQQKLIEIKNMGWIKSRRSHDTGIGKTFEDLLGITENNLQLPDIGGIEVKSSRSITKSMVTLITFEPPKECRNIPWTIDGLAGNFGKTGTDDKGKPVFHLTVYYGRYTDNRQQFKLDIRKINGEEMVCVVTKNNFQQISKHLPSDVVVCYPVDEIVERISRKLSGCLLLIEADSRKVGDTEMFRLSSAKLYYNFSIDKFIELLKSGYIALDIRFGRYPDGKSHNHGTGWRIRRDKIPELYAKSIDLLNDEIPSDVECSPKVVSGKVVKNKEITEYLKKSN